MGCVLLTGTVGFIGSHLGESLLREGRPIRGVDAFTDTFALGRKRDHLAALARSPMVELVTAGGAFPTYVEWRSLQ
jgi:nucleoside-diphosphate-sugar epimerase